MAIKLGTAFGIPIFIDYSLFVIFALIVWAVGFGLMPASYPNLSSIEYLSIGILSAILLFASIVVHELAHSVVAKRNELKIRRITLFLFGGVSEMEDQPGAPNVEIKISAAGPIVSIVIGIVAGVLWVLSADLKAPALVQAPLYYAFLVNELVAAFNLIPAFPMDGGRILRSVIWKYNKDFVKSTRIASKIGRMFAYLMMFGGVIAGLEISFFTGIWFILIGWFISRGAGSELNQTLVQRDLANLKAKDMMTRNVDSVSPDITLTDLSLEFLKRNHNGFPVMDNKDELLGSVTMQDLRRVNKVSWGTKRVRDIMTDKEKLVTMKETDPAPKVLALMKSNRIGRIFVMDFDASEKLSGIITRSDVMKTVQMEESLYEKGKNHEAISGLGRTISVEQGMMFELLPPMEGGVGWSPSFNSDEFVLISEKILQLSDGAQTKQFTFQPLQKGTFALRLVQSSSPGAASKEQRAISYAIVVGQKR